MSSCVGTQRSFADIVSKEIENGRNSKRALIRQQQECRPGFLDVDGFYVCGTGDETGRHSQKFSALATRETSWRLSDKPNESVPSSPGTWDASQYGYSDSEDVDRHATQQAAFQSIERALERSARVTPVAPTKSTRLGRPTTEKRNIAFKSADFSADESAEDHHRRIFQRRSRTAVPSGVRKLSSIRGRSVDEGRHLGEVANEKLRKKQQIAEPDDLTESKIRELVKENLALHRTVENLKEEIRNSEVEKKEERLKLLDSIAEKHQRRVRLIKEEFDFRLTEEREKAEQEIARISEREIAVSQTVKVLEQRVVQLETAERLAQEKSRNEERRADSEAKQTTGLKEQISASLSTVSQFSEKNSQLMKEIEALKVEVADRQKLEKLFSELQEKFQSLLADHESLSQKLDGKISELEVSQNQIKLRDQKIEDLSQTIHTLEEGLTSERCSKASLELSCSDLEARLTALTSEGEVLRQRHAECLEVARSAWGEVAVVKGEAAVLRQQLSQQELTMEHLKQFARGHQGVDSKNEDKTGALLCRQSRMGQSKMGQPKMGQGLGQGQEVLTCDQYLENVKLSSESNGHSAPSQQRIPEKFPLPTCNETYSYQCPSITIPGIQNSTDEYKFEQLPPHVHAWYNRKVCNRPLRPEPPLSNITPFLSTNCPPPIVPNLSPFVPNLPPVVPNSSVPNSSVPNSSVPKSNENGPSIPMSVSRAVTCTIGAKSCDGLPLSERQEMMGNISVPKQSSLPSTLGRCIPSSPIGHREEVVVALEKSMGREEEEEEEVTKSRKREHDVQVDRLNPNDHYLNGHSNGLSNHHLSEYHPPPPPTMVMMNEKLRMSDRTPTTASGSPLAGGFGTPLGGASLTLSDEFSVDWSRLSDHCSKEWGNQKSSGSPKSEFGDRGTVQTSSDESPCRSNRTTRLVKVMSQSGRCRYELQTISAA